MDDQLLFEQQVFGNNLANATGPCQFRQRGQ
jgi:hypothetical protein